MIHIMYESTTLKGLKNLLQLPFGNVHPRTIDIALGAKVEGAWGATKCHEAPPRYFLGLCQPPSLHYFSPIFDNWTPGAVGPCW
jgi:hypothetical protein